MTRSSAGLSASILDIEVRINLYTPWEYWAFLKGVPRLEILMHSIHYIDLLRLLFGEPRGVYCRGVRHPNMPDYPDVRTSIIFDYGETIRASLVMNHAHKFGPRYAVSELKVEGTDGAAIARMGVNLNYPKGEPERWKSRVTIGMGIDRRLEGRGSSKLLRADGESAALHRGRRCGADFAPRRRLQDDGTG